MKKIYRIENDTLHINDSGKQQLMLLRIAMLLTALSMSIQSFNQLHNPANFIFVLTTSLAVLSIVMFIYSVKKKTAATQIALKDIESLESNNFMSNVYYLKLKNGKQRNLTEWNESNAIADLMFKIKESYEV